MIIIEIRDLEKSLYARFRNAKSTRNKIIIFDEKIDFSNEIIDISKKKKLCDVLVDINIKNFVNLFLKIFFLIFIKKLLSQFRIKFDEKNNAINAIV